MKPVYQTIAIFVVGALVIIVTGWSIEHFKKPEVIEKNTVTVVPLMPPSCPSDFSDYQTLAQKQSVDLVKNFAAYATSGIFSNVKTVTLIRTGNDEIACGYLYVKAVKDHTSINPIDHVYINPNDFGGHIVASNSMPLGYTPATNTIEFLLPLNTITYLPDKHLYDNNATDFRVANWINLLNVSNQTTFEIASAIQNSNAVIEDIKIAYKCWNPSDTQNGGQETYNCQLGVQ